jgi:hypothetical protein
VREDTLFNGWEVGHHDGQFQVDRAATVRALLEWVTIVDFGSSDKRRFGLQSIGEASIHAWISALQAMGEGKIFVRSCVWA